MQHEQNPLDFFYDQLQRVMDDRDFNIHGLPRSHDWTNTRSARDGHCMGEFDEAVRRCRLRDARMFFEGYIQWRLSALTRPEASAICRDNVGHAVREMRRWRRLAWLLLTGSRDRGVCHA